MISYVYYHTLILGAAKHFNKAAKCCGPIILHANARLHTSNQTKNCLLLWLLTFSATHRIAPAYVQLIFSYSAIWKIPPEKLLSDVVELKICLNQFCLKAVIYYYYSSGKHKPEQRRVIYISHPISIEFVFLFGYCFFLMLRVSEVLVLR